MSKLYPDLVHFIQTAMIENLMEVNGEKQSEYLCDIYESSNDRVRQALDLIMDAATVETIDSALHDVEEEYLLFHLTDAINYHTTDLSPEEGHTLITQTWKALDREEQDTVSQALICATGYTMQSLAAKAPRKRSEASLDESATLTV